MPDRVARGVSGGGVVADESVEEDKQAPPAARGTRLIGEPAGAAMQLAAVNNAPAGSLVIAWAVMIRGYKAPEEDEVAAMFEHRPDAAHYADWWNREEIVRYGWKSPLRAAVEETDFYPLGTWRPPRSTSANLVRLFDK